MNKSANMMQATEFLTDAQLRAEIEKCEYCAKLFCHEDYPAHMAFERRHQGLAEEQGKLWRRRTNAPE